VGDIRPKLQRNRPQEKRPEFKGSPTRQKSKPWRRKCGGERQEHVVKGSLAGKIPNRASRGWEGEERKVPNLEER